MKVIIGSGNNTTFQPATDRGAPSRILVGSGSGGVSRLQDLSDVSVAGVNNNYVLVYDASTGIYVFRPTLGDAYNQANAALSQANAAYAMANVANNGSNTVFVYHNALPVLPNSTLNFNDSGTVNVGVVANGVFQTNVAFTVNTTAVGLDLGLGPSGSYVQKSGDTMTGNLIIQSSLNVANQIYANTVDFGPYELTSNTFTSNLNVPLEVDSFSAALYSTVKYIIQVKTTNNIHATEILCVQDGISTYMTEYATLASGGILGSFAVELSGGSMKLLFVPNNPTGLVMTFKVVRYSISS